MGDESPEWQAMSPEMRRHNRWYWDNDIRGITDRLRERFGDRLVRGIDEPVGEGYRCVVNVKALTVLEAREALVDLDERAQLIDLRSVRWSYADLRRIQGEMNDFIKTREDRAAKSASGIGSTTVHVWIRADAPQLWEAISERFGDAVEVRWGQSYKLSGPRPGADGPPRIAP